MASQREKEELTLPESISPHPVNCPVFPSTTPTVAENPITCPSRDSSTSSSAVPATAVGEEESSPALLPCQTTPTTEIAGPTTVTTASVGTTTAVGVRRCKECSKRVGLVGGFRCRCGALFCGDHRYSDRHDCGFDYKAAGRAAIERENPVVRAAKIVRI